MDIHLPPIMCVSAWGYQFLSEDLLNSIRHELGIT